MQQIFLPGKKVIKWIYLFLLFLLGLTGFGQMPIFKRYYIADIPGFGWLSDFYLTHYIHYIGAILLLALFGYCITSYFLMERHTLRLTWSGYTRIIILSAIIVTGIFRVLKNLSNVVFSPAFTMFIDISHLSLIILFILAGSVFLSTKSRWLKLKTSADL